MGRRLCLLGVAGAVAFGCTSGPTAPSGARFETGGWPPGLRLADAGRHTALRRRRRHLHFGVGRSVAGRYVLIDPYGWHAPTGDPWELDPRGAASVWLWKDGAAPSLR